MSSSKQIVLPKSVTSEINKIFKNDEFKAYTQLSEIFKQAILQKADPLERVANGKSDALERVTKLKSEQFTLSAIIKILKLSKNHRTRQHTSVCNHAFKYKWEDEILSVQTGISRGSKRRPCEIWFTPFGFLQCFQVFSNNKPIAKSIISVSFKITGWVLLTNGVHLAKIQAQVDYLKMDKLRLKTERDVESDNKVARKFSPWKEFCVIQDIPEDYTAWPEDEKQLLFKTFMYALKQNLINKTANTCYYYHSDGSRQRSLSYWKKTYIRREN